MTKEELGQYIAQKYEGKLTPLETGRYDLWYEVKGEDLLEVCRALKEDEMVAFDFLCNLSGVDTGENMQAVYSLASIKNNLRLDLKVVLPHEDAEIDTVQSVWPAANWHEREMWELYGINVKDHGNLKRFLLPDDWDQGYPMRKDWDADDFKRLPEV